MPDTLPPGTQIQLSPEQAAAFQPAALPPGSQVKLSPEQSAELSKQTGQYDPLKDFSAEQLVSLQRQNPSFNLVDEFVKRPELHDSPDIVNKLAEAHNQLRESGSFLDQYKGDNALETAGNVAKGVGETLWNTAKGFGKQAWNYAQGFTTPLSSTVAAVTEGPATAARILDLGQRQIAENLSGSEQAIHSTAKLVDSAAGFIGRKIGLAKPLKDYTPEEKTTDFFKAVENAKTAQNISAGKGPVMQAVGSEVVKDLESKGLPIRPEETQALSAGDPFSWYAMGKAFHAGGAVVPEVITRRAAQATAAAGDLAARVGGQAIETAADVTNLGSRAVAAVAPATSAVLGALKGAELHGPTGFITGAGLGYKAGQGVAEGAQKVAEGASKVSEMGQQIAGKAPIVTPLAQAGRDVLQSAPGAAADLAKGGAFDLGLAAVTSEESPEDRAGIGIGTAFGALGAGKRVGGRVLSGQIIAPRAYGSGIVVPSSGNFPALNAMHADAMKDAAPGIATRLNAIRLFTRGVTPNTDVYLAKDPASLKAALISSGVDATTAENFANTDGFFTTNLPDKNGTPRKVIVANKIDAAPHEAFHAIQDVLGEGANREIDKIVKNAYSGQWENLGEDYAQRLVGPNTGKTWREAILDASGWGKAEAADKIAMEISNRLRGDTGAEPNPDTVHTMAGAEWDRLLAEAVKRNPGVPVDEVQRNLWRDVLSPDEAHAVADRYLARELAAENFDAAFKHEGQELSGATPKLAKIVGGLVEMLGGNPIADRTSEGGNVPLSSEVVQKTIDVAKGLKPELPTVEPVPPKGKEILPAPKSVKTTIPSTPEAQQDAAKEAKTIADAASPTPPAPTAELPNPASPREVLGTIAEAIARRTGVKLNYHSAPDQPAAATTSNRTVRRAIIETFRNMPQAARALWEKNFFPERLLTNSKGIQVLGWAPEVFASNAHKLANTLIDVNVPSPYELDPKARSFSEQGWKELYEDVQKFVANQGAGQTGAGEALVMPKELESHGFQKPRETAGGSIALDQRRADFINMLFNFRLPTTARITGGKLPLNIAGQSISEATKPGRLSVPVEAKPNYTGEAAQKLGIEGRQILEVNPVRSEVEQAAKAAGVNMPSFIEAIQRLNAENINEVQLANEIPQFRGNTLTLTAGFQPKSAAEAMESMKNMDPEEWGKFTSSYDGKYGKGLSNWAVDQGLASKSNADLDAFRQSYSYWTDIFKQAMKEKDMVLMPTAASKAQAAREAFEAATGRQIDNLDKVSGTQEFLRQYKDPNFKAPLEPKTAQFSPKEDYFSKPEDVKVPEGMEKIESMKHGTSKDRESSGVYQSAWVMPDGIAYKVDSQGGKQYHDDSSKGFEDFNNTPIKNGNELQSKAGAMRVANRSSASSMDDYQNGDLGISVSKKPTPAQRKYIGDILKADLHSRVAVDITDAEGKVQAGQMFGGNEVGKIMRFFDEPPFAQFLPNKAPGAIKSAAVKDLEGKIHEGETHSTAYRLAGATGEDMGRWSEGFVTNSGEYLDRRKAFDRAAEHNQIKGFPATGSLNSENLDPNVKTRGRFLGLDTEDLKSQFVPKRNEEIEKIAQGYSKKAGIDYAAPARSVPVNEALAKRIADDYDAASHTPGNPEVVKSYNALIKETVAQWEAIKKAGYTLEPWTKGGEPYANSAAMVQDVTENKHLFFKPTDEDIQGKNLMLSEGTDGFPINDIFRAVHDFFGHAKEGHEFGPKGELNAWREHSAMYSEAAQPALAAETLAQNSWVNYGAHLRDESGAVPKKGEPGYKSLNERPFAPQKNTIVNPDLVDEARAQFQPGKLKLTHYSNHDKLEFLDPNFHGTGINGAERARKQGYPKIYQPRTYFGLPGYEKEPNLGPHKYEVVENKKDYYDFQKDPDNLYPSPAEVEKSGYAPMDRQAAVTIYEARIRNAGYKGYYNTSMKAAAKFERTALGKSSPRVQFSPSSEEPEFSLTGNEKPVLSTREIADMSRADLLEHFPEAVIPKDKTELIGSEIVNSPLYKKAGSEEKAVDAFAQRLVKFANENKNDPVYKLGLRWYSDFVPKLKKLFGKDAQIMAELLAATSPRNTPEVNYNFALDALESYRSGKFDKQISKLGDGLNMMADGSWKDWYDAEVKAGEVTNPPANPSEASFLAHWISKYDLQPRQSNGKLYGMHSTAVLQVMARKWMERNAGLKTRTFVSNLTGTGHEATIDVWADRTMRRLGYEGSGKRWRIMPGNSTAVSDEDFVFSQKAFRKAAQELGVKPDALQGGLWFAEKKHWSDNGWTRLDLGSFQKELHKTPLMQKAIRKRLTVEPKTDISRQPEFVL